jgi:Phosphatidylinositol-4-phosphate 5-Kinase
VLGLEQGNGFMDYSLLVGIRKMNCSQDAHTEGPVVDTGSGTGSPVYFSGNDSEDDMEWCINDKIRDLSHGLVMHSPTSHREGFCSGVASPPSDSTNEFSPFLDRTGFPSTDATGHIVGDEVYMLGVIDILEHYTLRKKIEHKLKSLRQRTWDSDTVSATDVVTYAHRFLDFIGSIVK